MNQKTEIASWAAWIASLGGFLQSYVTCVIAGALLFISWEFHLSALQQGHLASCILLGALVGSSTSGFLADRWGRKWTLFLAAALYFGTSLSTYFVSSYTFLVLVRIVAGYALGITSIVVPMYLAEIAPSAKRGTYVAGYQLSITLGTLIAYLANLAFTSSGDWRIMLSLAALPALVQLFGLFFLPESPKWLTEKKRPETTPLFSRPFFFLIAIGIALSAFQQFCGINAVIYYTPKIFSEAGFSDPKDAIFATLLVGIINIIATLFSLFLIDRFGRRRLFLISQGGVIAALLLLIAGFATESQFIDLIAVGGLLGFVFLYSIGLGPIVWVLISEIYPTAVRAKALALATFISWSCNYLVVLTFPSLHQALGPSWTFSIFVLLSLLILPFFIYAIPETKGKSLEELEKILVQKK